MDKEQLIAEILQEVMKRIQEEEALKKPKILILSDKDHTCGHCFTGDPDIGANYQVTCSNLAEEEVDPCSYEEVIVRGFNATNLVKVSSGIFDTPYLEAIGKALFGGIQVTVILDDCEAYRCETTAPKALLKMLNGKLDILRSWDVRIEKEACALARLAKKQNPAGRTMPDKKVITESDLKKAYKEGDLKIVLKKKTILTDMAKEFADRNKIEIQFV